MAEVPDKKDGPQIPEDLSAEEAPASVHEENAEKAQCQPGRDQDDALQFVMEHGVGHETVTEQESARLCRKIDKILMPLLFITYTLNFMDKQALSYSANFGLREDNHLTDRQYSWCSGSIFYIAYMVSQPVISRFLQIFPIGRFISVMVVAWGTLLLCTAASRSFASLMTLRFLLGSVESCINPAFVIVTSQWYTRSEQPSRISYWFIGNAVGQLLGGLIGYGVGHISYHAVGNWMWYFIIFGSITFLYSFVLLAFLPDNPMSARWLSAREKEVAVLRVLQNQTGIVNHKFKRHQFFEALRDPQTGLLFSIALLNTIPAGGIASYGSIVIKGFGYSALTTTLLNMPQGAIQLVSLLFSGWFTSRYKNTRCWMMGLSQIPGLIGSVVIYILPSTESGGKLGSYYLLSTHSVSFSMVMAMLSANYAGFTKKTTAYAIIFMGWCAGNIIAPQLFKESEAPHYRTVFMAQFICFSLLTVLPFVLQGYLVCCNKTREKEHPRGSEDNQHEPTVTDNTDREQKAHFRYVY